MITMNVRLIVVANVFMQSITIFKDGDCVLDRKLFISEVREYNKIIEFYKGLTNECLTNHPEIDT